MVSMLKCLIHKAVTIYNEDTYMKNTFKNLLKLKKIIGDMDKWIFILIITRSIFNAIIPFGAIIISGNVIDQIISRNSFKNICLYVLIGCTIVLIFYITQNILNKFCEQRKNICVRQYDTFISKHALKMKYEYLESEKLQEIRSKIQEDNNWGFGIYGMFSLFENFTQKLIAILISFFSIIPLFFKSVIFGIICLIYFAILIISIIFLLRFKKTAYKQQMESMVEVEKTNRLINYFIHDISYKTGKDTRIYQSQELINEKAAQRYFIIKKEMSKKIGNILGMSDGSFGMVVGLSEGIAYLLVAIQAINGIISTGEVVTYAGFINQFASAISYFVINTNEMIVHINRFVNTFEYLEMPEENTTGKNFDDKVDIIEFRNVSFSYPNNSSLALEKINIKIKFNDNIAIVGENGSGKSTFIKLLCRLYKPTSGKILLNGIDINDIDMNDYIKQIAVVFQDYSLFSIPIIENICAGDNINNEQVKKSLVQSGLEKRVNELDKKEQTPIFQELFNDGIELSGGESQKLAIARAIYKNAPILILDEPTASLDPFSESEIYQKLYKITEDKTSIFVSHRLASCKFCDSILVFDKGKIVQTGNHDELLEENGLYKVMWEVQASNYKI